MNWKFIPVLIILISVGCEQQTSPNVVVTKNYFEARNSSDFNELKNLINDPLMVLEGDHTMHYSQESFYEVFKWDSIFQTSYKIVELNEHEEQIIASIALSSIRNTFLKNKLMTCKFKMSFNSGKISKIESLDCSGADWNKWEQERDALVSWINTNHPELNGFIHDMSMKGAKDYVKAIELYESNKTAQ